MIARSMAAKENESDREIVFSRVFDAPCELVWDAWTDPKQIVQWWGPHDFTTTIHEMDVRPGGVWRHTMHGPDVTDYPNKSVFVEVVRHERIVYTHGGGKEGEPGTHFQAIWTFEQEEGDKTRLTIHMVFDSAEARDTIVEAYGAVEGGKQTLARLAGQLEKTPIIIERSLNAPIDTVWQAITDVDQMKQWYFSEIAASTPIWPALEATLPLRRRAHEYRRVNCAHSLGPDLHSFWFQWVPQLPSRATLASWRRGSIPLRADSVPLRMGYLHVLSRGRRTLAYQPLRPARPRTTCPGDRQHP